MIGGVAKLISYLDGIEQDKGLRLDLHKKSAFLLSYNSKQIIASIKKIYE